MQLFPSIVPAFNGADGMDGMVACVSPFVASVSSSGLARGSWVVRRRLVSLPSPSSLSSISLAACFCGAHGIEGCNGRERSGRHNKETAFVELRKVAMIGRRFSGADRRCGAPP